MPAYRDPFFWLIAALAAVLLLFNLGGRCLWEDEAETALLGRSILQHGVPIATGAGGVISQELGKEIGPGGVWTWSPWLQFYLAAAGSRLFGESAFAVRFPFALIAIAIVPLTYALARRLYDSVAVARFAALALATSVWFLLHARQARYCAPAYLFVCVILIAVAEMRRVRAWAIVFAVAGAGLFYTNYFLAICFVFAVAIASPLLSTERAFFVRLLGAVGGTALLSLPGVFYFDVFGKPSSTSAPWLQLGQYLTQYATFFAPLPLLVVAAWSDRRRRPTWFLLAVSLLTCAALARAPWTMFRYLTILFPVAAILIGTALAAISRASAVAAAVTTLLLVFTPLLHHFPLGVLALAGTEQRERPPSPLLAFGRELLSPPRDADCELAAFLQRNAAPHDQVLITYGDLLLRFYTKLPIAGGLSGTPWPPPLDARWIVRRPYVQGQEWKKDVTVTRLVDERIRRGGYATVLTLPDPPVAGNPDPAFHTFGDEPDAAPLHLYRRVRD